MRVEPKSEAEIQSLNLRDPGEYIFAVLDAGEKLSKSGNEMVELKVQMEDSSGRNFTIFDYLVSTESMAYKVRHFAESTGLLPQYEKGDMAAEYMIGRTGKCKLVVQPAKGAYPAKNAIADYIGVASGAAPAPIANARTPAELDDEIPF